MMMMMTIILTMMMMMTATATAATTADDDGHLSIMQLFHNVTNKGKLCYAFQCWCFAHVHDDDDDVDDNDDVDKIVRSNSTAPWNWFHEPIPQHRETKSTMYVELVRETNSTTP